MLMESTFSPSAKAFLHKAGGRKRPIGEVGIAFHPSIDDILFDYLMIFVLRSDSGQETNQILSNFIYSSDAFAMNSLFVLLFPVTTERQQLSAAVRARLPL